jgi:hypothetical protein
MNMRLGPALLFCERRWPDSRVTEKGRKEKPNGNDAVETSRKVEEEF